MASRKAHSDNQTGRLVFALRTRILSGHFAPGQRLTELELVSQLGASRTPVRLVLERLAYEGLLEMLPRGGFRVRSFTVPEIFDGIELRGVLEGAAVRLAAERLESADELAALRSLLGAAKLDIPVTIDGFSRFLQVNARFHREIWRLSKSTPLVRALEAACRIPFAAPDVAVFIEGRRETNDVYVGAEHHRAIVEAIEGREGTRGEALAREHARVFRRTLELALQHRDAMDKVPGAGLIV